MSASRISPTALYTGEVWHRHQRSFDELRVLEGRVFYRALQPAMTASRSLGGSTLEDFLLARHDLIDAQLHDHLAHHGRAIVIEIAAGLSPRGMRFVRQYGEAVTYIEADLPPMVLTKRGKIAAHLQAHPNHRVVPVDAFAAKGPNSLPALFESLPAHQPVVVITEGLLNYFDRQHVEQLFAQLASLFADRPGSLYVSDIHLQTTNQGLKIRIGKALLGAFVRGRLHLHYERPRDLIDAAAAQGLAAQLLVPSHYAGQFESCRAIGADLVSILVARPLNSSR